MIKTILVHLANDPDCAHRLRAATGLAHRLGVHLAGSYTTFPVGMPAVTLGRAASAVYINEATEVANEKAGENEKWFRETCDAEKLPHDWRLEVGNPTDALTRRLLYADVAIVSQTRPETLESLIIDYPPDHLSMVGDGPVVVVPHGYAEQAFGRAVLIGWKPTREAGRAVRGALPLLRTAVRVVVLTVGSEPSSEGAGRELVGHLKRHGVKAETHHDHAHDADAGIVLAAHAAEVAADMVVMGAYSHSRLRELVFGGATRKMLSAMKVPVLMAH